MACVMVVGLCLQACHNGKTYAEQKEEERKAIERFIDLQGIKVITESEFLAKDTTTDVSKNEYVLFSESGIYMQIIERGGGEIMPNGRHEVLVRYDESRIYINGTDSLTSYNSVRPTPDEMTVELLLPNGREVSYSMPVLKMIRYDDDTIFEKKLYFLVPFYLFNLEHYFKNRIEIADEDKASYDKELMSFKQKLMKALENRSIDTYTYRSLIDLFNKVVAALTVGKDSVWEETEAIMGGQVLDYEAKSILNEGVIKGTVEEAQFYGATFEAAVDRISTKFNLKPVEAEEAVGKYWK